jgi:hypothetical protein
MKKPLIPILFLAACALEHDDDAHDQVGTTAETGGEETTPTPDDDRPTLLASFYYEPADCSDHSVYFNPILFYSDGSSTDDVICRYELADGSVFDGCRGAHPVPSLQNVVMIAHDPVTGATSRFEQLVNGPRTLGAKLDVTADGLTISWQADAPYDGVPGIGSVELAFDPADNVIVGDPGLLRQREGSVRVTEPGTYTVFLNARIGFAEGFGCLTQTQKTVEVGCVEHHPHHDH